MANLFSEYNLKKLIIKNRVVMPPAVCFGWTDNSGMVSEDHIAHYEEIAKGGPGLIVIEATCIDKDGRLDDTQIGVWSDEHIDGLKKIAQVCHNHGAKVLVQIHHAGIKTPDSVIERASGPSEFTQGERTSRALDISEIHRIQEEYLEAARRVKQAGFDGIELHGAHGYLIDQFMSPITNKREDGYGGSLENRMRFGLEVVRKIRSEFGDDFILGYRMGGNAPTISEGIEIAKSLEKAGVDLLHVSAGIVGEELPKAPEGFPFNWIVYQGTEIRKHLNIPVIVVNGIRTPEQAEYLIENDMADFVALCKSQLADPEWANKAREGLEIKKCLECKRCQWFSDGKRCPRRKAV